MKTTYSVIPIIFGMAAVTYLPRLIPLLFLNNRNIPRRLDLFLKCIPATALGALIIPGVLQATPEMPMAALAGMGFTVVYGFCRGGLIIPVLGAVAVTCMVLFMAP